MRSIVPLATMLTVAAALTIGFSSAGASTKFAYTAQINDTHDLVVQFEEGAQRRFASVDYRLQGDAISQTPELAGLFEDLTATVGLVPDARGRVAGSLVLDIPSSPSPGPCGCGSRHVEYFNLTLTNLETGRMYRLDTVSRDFP